MNLEIPIELSYAGSNSDTSDFEPDGPYLYLNDGWFAGTTVAFYFEIVAENADSVDRDVELLDEAGTSLATVTVGSAVGATPTRIARVSFTPNSGADLYRLRLEGTTSASQLQVRNARIIVVITGATKAAVAIPQGGERFQYGNTYGLQTGNTSGSYTEDSDTINWKFTQAWFAGSSVSYFLHARCYNNSGTATSSGIRLYNKTDGAVVSSSTGTLTFSGGVGYYEISSSPAFGAGDDGDVIALETMRNGTGTTSFYTVTLFAIIDGPTAIAACFSLARIEVGSFFDTDRIPYRRCMVNKSAYSGDSVKAYIESCVWDRVAAMTQEFALHDQGTSDSSDSANALSTRLSPTSEVAKHGVYRSADMYSELTDGNRLICGGYSGSDDIRFTNFFLFILVEEAGGGGGITVSDQIRALTDSVTLGIYAVKTITAADEISALADEAYLELYVWTEFAIGDSISALADEAAIEIREHLSISVGDSISALADAVSLNSIANLTIQVGDSISALADGIDVVTGRRFGENILILVTMELEQGDDYSCAVDVRTPSRIYEGRIISYGSIWRSIEIPAGLPRVGDGSLKLADPDQKYRKLFAESNPKGKPITLQMVPVGGSTSTGQRVYRGEIGVVKFGPGTVTVPYSDITFDFFEEDIPILGTVVGFPSIPDEEAEIFAPIIFGNVTSNQGAIQAAHIDTVNHRYLVARHPVEEVSDVYRKRPSDDTFQLISSGFSIVEEDVTISGVTYTMTFVEFASEQDDGTEIQVNVKGMISEGETTAERNPANAVRNYLTEIAGLATSKIDLYSVVDTWNVCDDRSYLCDGAIVRPINHRAAIGQIAPSFNMDVFQDKNGKISLNITDENDTDRPDFDDYQDHLRDAVAQSLPDPVYNRVRYFYSKNYSTGDWENEVVYDNEADQETLGKIVETKVELPFVRNSSTAVDVIGDIASYFSLASYQFETDLPAPEVIDRLELAKLIGITHYGGIEATGVGYTNEEFKIQSVRFDLDKLKYRVKAIRQLSPPPTPRAGVVDGEWSQNSRTGPFSISNGIFFGFFLDADDQSILNAWKSLDWGQSFTKVVGPQLDNDIGSFDCEAYGAEVRVATQEQTTGRVAYHVFNMASMSWSTLDEEVEASVDIVSGSKPVAVSISSRRDDGAPVLAHEIDKYETGSPVEEYRRFGIRVRSGGSWSSALEVGGGGEYDYFLGRIAPGKENLIHIFYNRDPGDFVASTPDEYHQTLNNSGSLVNNYKWISSGLSYYPATHNEGNIATLVDGEDVTLFIPVKGGAGKMRVYTIVSSTSMTDPTLAVNINDAYLFEGGGGTVDGDTDYPAAHCHVTEDGFAHLSFSGFRSLLSDVQETYKSNVTGSWYPPTSGSTCPNDLGDLCAFEHKLGPIDGDIQKMSSLVWMIGGDHWIARFSQNGWSSANNARLAAAGIVGRQVFEVLKVDRDLPRDLSFDQDALVDEILGE